MNHFKISVIIPIYNVEKYIDKCIKSILVQTYSNFELILVNDGSTDSSYERIIKYESDQRVVIINKPNTGQSDSRYQGLLKSTGDYVYFVDSDDTIEKYTLEVLANDVLKHNSDIVFGRYRLVDELGKELRKQSLYNVNVLCNNINIVKDSLCVNNFKASLWLKLIKRSTLLNCYSEEVRKLCVNEDILLSFLLSTKCNIVSFRNEIIYNVLQRSDSLTRAIKPELITSSDIIYREINYVLKRKSIFYDMQADYYRGYIKALCYALAVAAKHTSSFQSFFHLYAMLDDKSILYSNELGSNLKLLSQKYRVLYFMGKRPKLFYYTIRIFKKVLQY